MSRYCQANGWDTAVLTLLVLVLLSPETRLMAQAPPTSTGASVVDGVFTIGQASRGRQQFQVTCTACHGASEHTGRKFETKWQGTTVGDLFELVSTTMPQADPGSLKPDEYASIVAFLLSETGYKAGAQELPSDLESLKKIRIEPVPR
jgi:S-disulfanyl-L-cysteine oxidoreductase SoxD